MAIPPTNAFVGILAIRFMKEKTKKLIIKPPHIALMLLLLSWMVDYFFPQFRFIYGTYRYIGILVFIFGLLITFSGFYLFKKHKTPVIPGQRPEFMVASGPYKITRNPMYLGVTIALLGVSVYVGNLLSLLAPVIFLILMGLIYIPFEEELMENIFGKKYIDYKHKVRRWL